MNTFAPEFSALMIILRSVGPVISTRRSCRSAGIGATFQSAVAHRAGLGRKSGQFPRVDAGLALLAGGQQLLHAGAEPLDQFGEEGQRGLGQHGVELWIARRAGRHLDRSHWNPSPEGGPGCSRVKRSLG